MDAHTNQMQAYRTYAIIVSARYQKEFKERELAKLEFQQKLDQHATNPKNYVDLLDNMQGAEATPEQFSARQIPHNPKEGVAQIFFSENR